MTRNEAMEELTKPAYDTEEMRKDFEFVAKKLDLTSNELDKIMKGENRTYKNSFYSEKSVH